jgi:ABC-type amino acid transport substrate-binding protein
MIRALALAAALAAGAGSVAAQDITIGMRADAKPFVQEVAPGRFEGFLADICRAAVVGAGYPGFTEQRIDASTRLGDPADGRIAVDVVCDPTTITLERAGRLDFTPIVFIANATFVSRESRHFLTADEAAASESCADAAAGGLPVVAAGMVTGTTAMAAFELALGQGFLGNPADFNVCAIAVGSHVQGIERLCSGDLSYYFGDSDILRAFLTDRPDCRASFHSSFLTYEPYALVVNGPDATFRRRFVQAIYGLFSDGSVEKFYEQHFGTRRRSAALDTLFSINSVPRGAVNAD